MYSTPLNAYYVYILSNLLDTVLYIGVTNDLLRRVQEHKSGVIDGFTKKYHVHKLVFYEAVGDVQSALAREKQLKGFSREKKRSLVKQQNPEWLDLSLSL